MREKREKLKNAKINVIFEEYNKKNLCRVYFHLFIVIFAQMTNLT